MILVIDNYDSFTYNLVQALAATAAADVVVVRNDRATAADLLARPPRAIVVSPGPGVPEGAGVSIDLIRAAGEVPVLGVCLGHQALAVAYGGRVGRAPVPVHGKTSPIFHGGDGLFAGLPNPFAATRYHSLVVDPASLPEELAVTAWTEDHLVMALAHRTRPHLGVQFHPESYMSREGETILAGFLGLAGVPLRRRPADPGGGMDHG